MKKFFNLLRMALLCAFLSASLSTYAQKKVPPHFLIKGYISGVKDGTTVRLIDLENQKVTDSAKTLNGNFKFYGHVDQPSAFWIRCLQEYATIQVENVAMTFTSPLKAMKTSYVATGGREQALQTSLDQLQRKYEKTFLSAYDSLTHNLYTDSSERKRLVKKFQQAEDAYMNIYITFGKEHIDSYLGLDILYRNRNSISKDSVSLLYEAIPAQLKATKTGKSLYVFAIGNLVKKGQHFQDFKVYSIEGKHFQLSSLKGKYIYLTFGSANCKPCRIENKEISKNYLSLSKLVDIVNFSLDVNLKDWRNSARVDKIVWHNVSDMAGGTGKIKTLYDIQAMPTSFLIDKNGIIVQRFDGYSPDNIKQVEQIVSTHISP